MLHGMWPSKLHLLASAILIPSTFAHGDRRRPREQLRRPPPHYSAQSTFKKDPDRARQNSLATVGTNFSKPRAHNKGDLCTMQTK